MIRSLALVTSLWSTGVMGTGDEVADVSGLVDWGDLFSTDHRSEDWLARPIIPRGRSVAIVAEAKKGKSLLALDIAASLAAGRSVLGEPAKPPVKVMYVDYEMTLSDLAERMNDLGYSKADAALLQKSFFYYQLPEFGPLNDPRGAAKLIELATGHGVELVVFDTLGLAVEGAENDADTYRDLARYTGSRLKKAGIAQLRTDHKGHGQKRGGGRGSSAKAADVDVTFDLDRSKDLVKLTHNGARLSWIPNQIDLKLTDSPLAHEWVTPLPAENVQKMIGSLDAAKVPPESSYNQARNDYGITGKKTDLLEALKIRKERDQ